MTDKQFKLQCAQIVLTYIKGKFRSGRETRISIVGHFWRENFLPEGFLRISTGEFFRLMMNVWMEECTNNRDIFLNAFLQLGEFIADVADEFGDEINQEHCHKK